VQLDERIPIKGTASIWAGDRRGTLAAILHGAAVSINGNMRSINPTICRQSLRTRESSNYTNPVKHSFFPGGSRDPRPIPIYSMCEGSLVFQAVRTSRRRDSNPARATVTMAGVNHKLLELRASVRRAPGRHAVCSTRPWEERQTERPRRSTRTRGGPAFAVVMQFHTVGLLQLLLTSRNEVFRAQGQAAPRKPVRNVIHEPAVTRLWDQYSRAGRSQTPELDPGTIERRESHDSNSAIGTFMRRPLLQRDKGPRVAGQTFRRREVALPGFDAETVVEVSCTVKTGEGGTSSHNRALATCGGGGITRQMGR